MKYEILEAHCVFEDEKLTEVAVLWADKELVRATCITSQYSMGYDTILESDVVSPQLFQKAAGRGMYLDESKKKKYFPGKRNWSR